MVGSAVVAFKAPARAEENLGEKAFRTENAGSYTYNVYMYPNLNQGFYLPDNYETRFDIHNGKFWMLEYHEFQAEDRAPFFDAIQIQTPKAVELRCTIAFYTPRGELIKDTGDRIRPNWFYTTPMNRTSLEYDRLEVRIRNHSHFNRDLRFVVMDPVDAVRGTPVPQNRETHL
jgi:hypothetical protein